MKCVLFINSVLIFNFVDKSDEFLITTFEDTSKPFLETKMCLLSDSDSISIEQIIEFHNISKENCDEMIKNYNFARSVHFTKTFSYNNPVFLVGTKKDIETIAHQFQVSTEANVPTDWVESSDDSNLQHFLEWFYTSRDFLTERTNFATFSDFPNNFGERIKSFRYGDTHPRVKDLSNSSVKNFDNIRLMSDNLVLLNASHNQITKIREGLFDRSQNVRYIDLSSNQIKNLDDDYFSKLAELKIIDLSNNQITDVYGSFDRNEKLKTIHLQNSRIKKLDCDILKLIERSVVVDASFRLESDLKTQCKDRKLRFSADHEEMVIRSTETNKEMIRINSTAFTGLDIVLFGENQLVNATTVLDVLGSSVRLLYLSENYIGKIDVTTFQRFTELERLYLSRTNLSEFDGNPFEHLIYLTYLDISNNNNLRTLDAKSLSSTLRRLIEIDVSGNNLENAYEIIQYLGPELHWLNLSRNYVGKLNASTLQKFKKLWSLGLTQTSLNINDFEPFVKLTVLIYLDIDGNKLTNLNFTLLSSLKQLESFNISRNSLGNTVDVARHLNPSVKVLNVSDNYLGKIDESTFSKFDRLETLSLRCTNLTSFNMKMIKSRSLKELDISHNQLSSVDFSSVKSFQRIETLNVSWNQLEELKGLTPHTYPKLKYLYIDGNQIACKYISDLNATFFGSHLEVIGNCDNQTKVEGSPLEPGKLTIIIAISIIANIVLIVSIVIVIAIIWYKRRRASKIYMLNKKRNGANEVEMEPIYEEIPELPQPVYDHLDHNPAPVNAIQARYHNAPDVGNENEENRCEQPNDQPIAEYDRLNFDLKPSTSIQAHYHNAPERQNEPEQAAHPEAEPQPPIPGYDRLNFDPKPSTSTQTHYHNAQTAANEREDINDSEQSESDDDAKNCVFKCCEDFK